MKDSILIVEDETNIRANMAEFLQAEDFETVLAKRRRRGYCSI